MIPPMLVDILAMYRDDNSLQALLDGTASIDTKVAFALVPPCYPSVILHVDREVPVPRAGYDYNGVVDIPTQLAIHVYSQDEGKVIGGINYDANSLQMAIADRVRVLSLNIDKTVPGLRDIDFTSTPLPFEEDTHVHHTSCLLKFTYSNVDTL